MIYRFLNIDCRLNGDVFEGTAKGTIKLRAKDLEEIIQRQYGYPTPEIRRMLTFPDYNPGYNEENEFVNARAVCDVYIDPTDSYTSRCFAIGPTVQGDIHTLTQVSAVNFPNIYPELVVTCIQLTPNALIPEIVPIRCLF